MAHKNPGQLKTLLSLLDHPRVDLFVHIDKKSRGFDQKELSSAVRSSGITFVPRRKIVWGSRSQIECEFRLMEAALPGKYAYYHLLSGLDLPLKRMDEILSFFDENCGKEFVSFQAPTVSQDVYRRASFCWPFQGVTFCRPFFLYLQDKLISLQKKKGVDRLKGKGITLYKGANWFSCTHGYLSLICRDKEELLRLFSNSFCCDEVFLQTHLMTTEYRERLFDNSFSDQPQSNMRLVDWQRGSPYTFCLEDRELLLETDLLFARKFDEKKDPDIIELLVNRLK